MAIRFFVGAAVLALVVALVTVAFLTDDGATTERQHVLAPIDATNIRVLESFPPQYMLNVVAGLPNGCARADGYEVSRLEDTVRVRIFNTMPVDNVVCAQVYGTYELNIPLGSDFQSGRDYGVDVNGQQETLRAQ